MACHLNLATCGLCINESSFKEVVAHCDNALSLQLKNTLALLRRGQANRMEHCFGLALKDFNHALETCDDNPEKIKAIELCIVNCLHDRSKMDPSLYK